MFKTIIITGCGGDIGYSIGQLIKENKLAEIIIGTDIHSDHAGEYLFDRVEILPKANDESYFPAISLLIEKNTPDILIPTSEAEILFFYKNKIRNINSTKVLMANDLALSLGLDKLKTFQYLSNLELGCPWTLDGEYEIPDIYPCIRKKRFSAGSKDICILTSKNDVKLFESNKGYIFQELLLPDSEEYTCGLFRSKYGETRHIIIKRKLQNGLTISGVIVKNNDISELLIKLANSIELIGSINIQLRLTSDGPKVFEINSRFSSTVLFRYLLGFKDLLWSLENISEMPISPYNENNIGKKIYRLSREVILPPPKK